MDTTLFADEFVAAIIKIRHGKVTKGTRQFATNVAEMAAERGGFFSTNGAIWFVTYLQMLFDHENAFAHDKQPACIIPHFRISALSTSRGVGCSRGTLREVTDAAEIARRQAAFDAWCAEQDAEHRQEEARCRAELAGLYAVACSGDHSKVRWVPRRLSYIPKLWRDRSEFIDVVRALARNPLVREDEILRGEVRSLTYEIEFGAGVEIREVLEAPAPAPDDPAPDDPTPDDPAPDDPAPDDPAPDAPKIVNLCPHALNIRTRTGEIVTVPPSGATARCTEVREDVPSPIPAMRVSRARYGEVVGLPAPEPGTIYVVSAIVLNALHGSRPDVFCPGPGIKDEKGSTVACDGLSCY
jgi:hypothetical protein